MDKKACLEEIYNSTFNEELDKIAQDEYRYYCQACGYEDNSGGVCPECGAMMFDSEIYDDEEGNMDEELEE